MGFRSLADIRAFIYETYRQTGNKPHELPIYEDDLDDLINNSLWYFIYKPSASIDTIMGLPVKRLPPR